MVLYKSVLHNSGNSFPKWYLEVLGTYVSKLITVTIATITMLKGLKRTLGDDVRFTKLMKHIADEDFGDELSDKMVAGIAYAKVLTLDHASITAANLDALRQSGFDDGEILEVNQVVSYFNYVNRMVVGLGVNTEGDIIGLSPNDNGDENNWAHQ